MMTVNFLECTTLDWILIREEIQTEIGFSGTSYTDPHVILKRLEVLNESSTDMGGAETKRYSPGIYRTIKKEGWPSG